VKVARRVRREATRKRTPPGHLAARPTLPDVEDRLRKVGMSKEHRVDPQVTVGLLTTGSGFPLEVHLFEGNKAETKTLVPVLTGFAERHHVDKVVVVADAGMLSAANLLALEEAEFGFIVASKPSSAADDLAEHFRRHGNYFTDGQTVEATPHHGHRQGGAGTAGGL
jgi:transposase